ncbi:hypothetical protein COTS27_00801 [Spirochaetota bacterium]|nr:hypothetical protein COTS27_00801 [Spirochaetota bacterium]
MPIYSIYHFFKEVLKNKNFLLTLKKLENFPFNSNLLACQNKGLFPDLAIRINKNSNKDIALFSGGELIELKDSKSYSIASFNSTIPTGKKEINKVITSSSSTIKKQMEANGNNIYSLPVRDVFYLIRGLTKNNTKVCLVHGSFFETLPIDKLIQNSLEQSLNERLHELDKKLPTKWKNKFLSLFTKQENFSRVRNIEKASVKLRFRIMTEIKAEGNILNSKTYPEILDNTLNFILPLHQSIEESNIFKKMNFVFTQNQLNQFKIFKIKHLLNGYFLVFQTSLSKNQSK